MSELNRDIVVAVLDSGEPRMGKKITTAKKGPGAIERFLALSDAEKEAVYQSYDREIPLSETRPLTAAERKSWERTQSRLQATHAKKQKAPATSGTIKGVQVSIEGTLLADADAFAAAHGLKRAQLFSIGLRIAMAAIPAAQIGLSAK